MDVAEDNHSPDVLQCDLDSDFLWHDLMLNLNSLQTFYIN